MIWVKYILELTLIAFLEGLYSRGPRLLFNSTLILLISYLV